MNEQSVTDLMMARFKKPKKGGINSQFGEAVSQVMKAIPDQRRSNGKKYEFRDWCGRLRNIPPWDILEMLKKANKNKTPGRLFNYLINNYK